MKFKVTVSETLERVLFVDASDWQEAEKKVKDMWDESELVLSADDFTGVEFYTEEA